MRNVSKFIVWAATGLGPALVACDEAADENGAGEEVSSIAASDVDDVEGQDVELGSGLTLTEFVDGRRRFRAEGVDGARALLDLVEAGEVTMEAAARGQLREHIKIRSPGGGGARAYGPCTTPLGSGTVQVQRKWLWVWSGYDVSASAQWAVPGFGPKPSVRAEALVCVNGDCEVESTISVGPNVHLSRLVALSPHSSVLAAAKVENTARTCYFASVYEYWP